MSTSVGVGVPSVGRALVVDDEETVGQIMGYVLKGLGYEVDQVVDGNEALRMAREHRYDAVVCDLLMPGITGMALYETWQSEDPGLARRMIFVTGDSLGTDTSEFVARTGCPCIYKPFKLGQLAELVASVSCT